MPRSSRAWGSSGWRVARRTPSSRGSTCATTPSTSPRISSSRRRPIRPTSRRATCCATPGRERPPARGTTRIVARLWSAGRRRPRRWPRSRVGTSPRSAAGWAAAGPIATPIRRSSPSGGSRCGVSSFRLDSVRAGCRVVGGGANFPPPARMPSPPRSPLTRAPHSVRRYREGRTMNRIRFAALVSVLLAACLLASVRPARPFCGFYVAQGDAKLYNQSSKVVIARDGDRTVLTMSSDYQGDPKEFAMVIPVPVVLKKEQVHVADKGIVERLNDYSVPRLVEYWDPNPCPNPLAEDVPRGV